MKLTRALYSACLSSSLLLAACPRRAPEQPRELPREDESQAVARAASASCEGDGVDVDGARRLALLVGVGRYKQPAITPLRGPPRDVAAIYRLLTDKSGYAFPEQNVCVLLDEGATVSNVRRALNTLSGRVRRPEDQVLFYYSGHGSQAVDKDGDEPDGWDETLVLHDSRTDGVKDLLDDELGKMVAEIHAKTKNITLIFDSCNSGSAGRGGAGLADSVARWAAPEEEPDVPDEELERFAPDGEARAAAEQPGAWTPYLEGVVQLSAAIDGTSALEPARGGNGYFTAALLETLGAMPNQPQTWSAVARTIDQSVAAASKSQQQPRFMGDLEKLVFSNVHRARPQGWEVRQLGDPVHLAGVPMPGFGPGAVLQIYPGAVLREDLGNPTKIKARVTVVDAAEGGFKASAKLVDAPKSPIALGDLAMLAVPSPETHVLEARLRTRGPGALSETFAEAIQAALKDNVEVQPMVRLVEQGGAFEVSQDDSGRLVIRGPEGIVRNLLPAGKTDPVVFALGDHARALAMLSLRGEPGQDFVNDQTLKVEILRSDVQSPCAGRGWEEACPGEAQSIPLCTRWRVKVTNTHPTIKLHVGGVALFNDGKIAGFPEGGNAPLAPGQSQILAEFTAVPPLEVEEHLMVFGTREDNLVNWAAVTSRERGQDAGSPLQRALNEWLHFVPRAGLAVEAANRSTWTSSHRSTRVLANAWINRPGRRCGGQTREYTVKDFDLRPYFPANSSSALSRVLRQAHDLAHTSATDGVPYKQHPWKLATEAANLRKGIDCSRAIWLAFKRAGVPYNSSNSYLDTSRMLGGKSRMREDFDRCDKDPQLRTGDVLVYRGKDGAGRLIGHTVLVIDPERRIAWGAHGWDSAAEEEAQHGDTGVEYQQIRSRESWASWDVRQMRQVGCWRHKEFSAQWSQPGGRPGEIELGGNACDPRDCPAR